MPDAAFKSEKSASEQRTNSNIFSLLTSDYDDTRVKKFNPNRASKGYASPKILRYRMNELPLF